MHRGHSSPRSVCSYSIRKGSNAIKLPKSSKSSKSSKPFLTSMAVSTPPTEQSNNPLDDPEDPASIFVPNSPFTRRISSSPMPQANKNYYTELFHESVLQAIDDVINKIQGPLTKNVMSASFLLPELNPALDIYDRRFLIRVIWRIAMSLAEQMDLKVCLMTQSAMQFGGLPLSVAGIQKLLKADLDKSQEDWSENLKGKLQIRDILPDQVDDSVDVFIMICPTNASSAPAVTDVIDTVKRIGKDKPVLLINPRLNDVPSHSGVMQVQGRAERISFLESIQRIFVLELLYKSGTWYPLLGIVYRAYPNPWYVYSRDEQVTKILENKQKVLKEDYDLVWTGLMAPSKDQISEALKAHRVKKNKEMSASVSPELSEGVSTKFSLIALSAMIGIPSSLAFVKFVLPSFLH